MGFLSKLFGGGAAKNPPPEGRPLGEVTHYFNKIGVGIVKCSQPFSVGDVVRFYGATTDFTQPITSMQYDHQDISSAKKGQEVGIKVGSAVREGDQIYKVS